MSEDSVLISAHLPCGECGSSDGLSQYSNHTFCFVCNNREWSDAAESAIEPGSRVHQGDDTRRVDIPQGTPQALNARGIHQETCEKWGYQVGTEYGKTVHIAVYRDPKSRQPVGAKVRDKDKNFHVVGKLPCLYGEWLWPAGGKMLVIVEGEIDALSVSQAQGNKYPVVSIPQGAQGAAKAVARSLEWVSSFERVVIWFDNDNPGIEAAGAVAEILPPGTAFIVKSDLKDANEYIKASRTGEITKLVWGAAPYRPDGIVAGTDITLESIRSVAVPGYTLPYPRLNGALRGLRKRELTLLSAGSGVGKSTLAREIAYHLHQAHGLTIGNVFLEESKEKTAQGYVAIHNNIPLGKLRADPSCLRDVDWQDSLETVVHDRMYFYDHFGSLDSDNLLSRLRYLAVGCHCDFIVLDHISIVVSGMEASSEGERRDIDILMTKLRSLVENTGVGIIAIVHLKQPEGKAHEEGGRVTLSHLRGSGSLKQLPDNIIAVERDQQGDFPNLSLIRLLKNREFGDIGPQDEIYYDSKTGRLLPYVQVEEGRSASFNAEVPF